MKTLLKSAIFFVVLSYVVLSYEAQADVLSCELQTAREQLDPSETWSLIIREDVSPTEAILMQSYSTLKYTCYKKLSFEYECYGHRDDSYSAPIQLNISSTKAGSVVVHSTISIPFLQSYAQEGFNFKDFKERRIAMDTYIIKHCD